MHKQCVCFFKVEKLKKLIEVAKQSIQQEKKEKELKMPRKFRSLSGKYTCIQQRCTFLTPSSSLTSLCSIYLFRTSLSFGAAFLSSIRIELQFSVLSIPLSVLQIFSLLMLFSFFRLSVIQSCRREKKSSRCPHTQKYTDLCSHKSFL